MRPATRTYGPAYGGVREYARGRRAVHRHDDEDKAFALVLMFYQLKDVLIFAILPPVAVGFWVLPESAQVLDSS